MNLFPKNPQFFDLFEELALLVKSCGEHLMQIKNGSSDAWGHAPQVRALELKADELYHRLIHEADSTFITPIDREDIHALSRNLDDLSDLIEDLVSKIALYKVKEGSEDFNRLTTLIHQAATSIHQLMGLLKHPQKNTHEIKRLIESLHVLENQGDDLVRQGIASLFSNGHDILNILQWKDIFEDMEEILDQFEEAADTVNQIVIKNY